MTPSCLLVNAETHYTPRVLIFTGFGTRPLFLWFIPSLSTVKARFNTIVLPQYSSYLTGKMRLDGTVTVECIRLHTATSAGTYELGNTTVWSGHISLGLARVVMTGSLRNHVYQCKAKGVFRNRKIKPLWGIMWSFLYWTRRRRKGNIDAILPAPTSSSVRRWPMWTRLWWCLPSPIRNPI